MKDYVLKDNEKAFDSVDHYFSLAILEDVSSKWVTLFLTKELYNYNKRNYLWRIKVNKLHAISEYKWENKKEN